MGVNDNHKQLLQDSEVASAKDEKIWTNSLRVESRYNKNQSGSKCRGVRHRLALGNWAAGVNVAAVRRFKSGVDEALEVPG